MRATVRRPPSRTTSLRLAGIVLLLLAAPVFAQTEGTTPTDLPHLKLTDAQRQTIYLSVVNQNFRNEAPPNFQPRVGAVVPAGIRLEPIPKTILELIPQTEAFQLARIVNQVVIVEPQSRRVVEVVSGKQP